MTMENTAMGDNATPVDSGTDGAEMRRKVKPEPEEIDDDQNDVQEDLFISPELLEEVFYLVYF